MNVLISRNNATICKGATESMIFEILIFQHLFAPCKFSACVEINNQSWN